MPYGADPTRWGGMRNEATQAFILKKLERLGVVIDPYDGARFSRSSLRQLKEAIRVVSNEVAGMPSHLDFRDEEIRFFESYLSGVRHLRTVSPQSFALEELWALDRLAEQAIEDEEELVFFGD